MFSSDCLLKYFDFHQLAWWVVGRCVGVSFVYFGFGQECVHEGVGVCAGLSL